MKIQVVVFIMTMVLAFGDAIKCYSCAWSKDGKYPNNDERCVNPAESLPDEFLIDCQQDPIGWDQFCQLVEIRDDENMKIDVERSCYFFDAAGHECTLLPSGSNSTLSCTCDRDGCNNITGN